MTRSSARRCGPVLIGPDPLQPVGRIVGRIRIDHWHPPAKNELTKGKLRDSIRLRKACRTKIQEARAKIGLAPADGPRRVWLRVGYAPANRSRDVDAYWQALLDSLKGARLIRNDSPEHCVIMPARFYRDDHDWMELILEAL